MSTKPTAPRPAPIVAKELDPGAQRPLDYLLDPPYTSPLPVVPVVGAAYGVGLRHIENELNYVFEPWIPLLKGDRYIIYMNGINMAEGRVTDENLLAPRFYVNIPRTTLPLGFVPDVYGEIRREGTGTPLASPPQTIFIKDTRPGGADDRPHENWHSKLVLTLSHTFIDAAIANQGIWGTIPPWEHQRVNDLVIFYWGEHRFEVPPITEDQVGQDLRIFIDPNFIKLAGSGHFVVQFYLFDEVHNRSGELQPWCKPVPVDALLDLTRLKQPFVVEADDAQVILDTDLLGKKPAHIEVEVLRNSPDFVVGDYIYLTVHGTTFDGKYTSVSYRQLVDKVPQYYEFPIRNEFVRDLIRSTLTAEYVRERAGVDDKPSSPTTVTVTGVRYDLPRPSVKEAHGPFIEPGLERITVQMPDYQPPGAFGDDLVVDILGRYLDGTIEHVTSSQLAGIHPRTRDFSNAQYMRFEGLRETSVQYAVAGTTGTRNSERRWVQIGRPARDLYAPVFLDAVNGNVDPATVGSAGLLELRADLKQGDHIIVKITGSSTGDILYEFSPQNPSNPLIMPFKTDLYTGNVDGTLTASYLIDRFGVFQYSEERVVTIGTALGELFMPEVLLATIEPNELDPKLVWPKGATVRVRYETIKARDQVEACWKGLPGVGTYFEVRENPSGDFIDFTIPTETIGFNIHPDGRDIQVSFRVIRNNFSTCSPTLFLRLLTLHDLPGPVISSIGDHAVLEIPLLQDRDITSVKAWNYARLSQLMWFQYKGTSSNGDPFFREEFRGRQITQGEVLAGINERAPVLDLRDLKDGSDLTISFWVTFNGDTDRVNAVLFRVRHYLVQLKENTYPYPKIKPATPVTPGDEQEVRLDPVVAENKCQVLVSYDNMNAGGIDLVYLLWARENGSMPFIEPQGGLDGGTVTFNIDNSIFGNDLKSKITLQYKVDLARGGTVYSEEQRVIVGTLALGDLPAPRINNIASGGTLNPPTMTEDATVSVSKWRFSEVGQRPFLEVSSPGLVTQKLRSGEPINEIEKHNGLSNIRLSRSWLLGVPHNGSVTVSMSVIFDVTSSEQEHEPPLIVFPSSVYTVQITRPLVFDTSSVRLAGSTYLIPGNPEVLPAFNSGNSYRRTASGGTAPYFYTSSATEVAVVDSTGYVTVRGNGSTRITVRDSSVPAQTRSYDIAVSGVVLCYGLGGGSKTDIDNRARNQGVRLASLNELYDLRDAYGSRWPMGNAQYWSSTWSHNQLFFNYWYALNINAGGQATSVKEWVGSQLLGVGLR